jgi:hypothetical protein
LGYRARKERHLNSYSALDTASSTVRIPLIGGSSRDAATVECGREVIYGKRKGYEEGRGF